MSEALYDSLFWCSLLGVFYPRLAFFFLVLCVLSVGHS